MDNSHTKHMQNCSLIFLFGLSTWWPSGWMTRSLEGRRSTKRCTLSGLCGYPLTLRCWPPPLTCCQASAIQRSSPRPDTTSASAPLSTLRGAGPARYKRTALMAATRRWELKQSLVERAKPCDLYFFSFYNRNADVVLMQRWIKQLEDESCSVSVEDSTESTSSQPSTSSRSTPNPLSTGT